MLDIVASEALGRLFSIACGFDMASTTGVFLMDPSALKTVLVWGGGELLVLQLGSVPG